MDTVAALIDEIIPSITDLRHEIHAYPELGLEEHETARRIVAQLAALGNLDIRTGLAKTGVVATLNGDKPGRCVALRAELDALPILEQTGLPYASKNPGKMHACGHDGHMACLVGAAKVLSRMAADLPGKVKFIFQPAEESYGGGRMLCEEGVLENPNVDAIFALHGWPMLDLGTAGVNHGSVLASTNPWSMTVHGVGAHAAYPHKGIDPIVVGSHIVTALQTIVSRSTDPLDSVVVTVGKFQAGTAQNVIAATAELAGTIRTLNPQARIRSVMLVEQVAARTAEAFGARVDIQISEGYPVLVNNWSASELVLQIARSVLSGEHVRADSPPSMGGEDFAYYAERVPASFWRLGVRRGDPATQPSLHQPNYDFPDAALPIGIRMHCEIARRFLKEGLPARGTN